MHALVAEAMKKAAIIWICVDAEPAYPVWCMPAGDALCVVTGGVEQPAPGLLPGATVRVSARGDHGGRIVTWPAHVERIEPGGEAWQDLAPQLAAKRLNAPGTSEAVIERWSRESLLLRLVPAGDTIEVPADADARSGAAVPVPTPAARRTAKPFRLHRVKRRS